MSQLTFSWETPSAVLTPDDIFLLVDEGELLGRLFEDKRLERKSAGIHCRKLGEYICMWANTAPSGGLIAVGIEDSGEITGCHRLSQEQVNNIEKAAFVFCSEARTKTKTVAARANDDTATFIILIRVSYRDDKVVLDSSSHAYVRIGDEKHQLSADQIRELQIDKGQLDLEQEPTQLAFPEDFNPVLLRRFIEGLKRTRKLLQEHSDVDLLEHRHLGKVHGDRFIPNAACTFRPPDLGEIRLTRV